MPVAPKPGEHTITAHLCVDGAAEAIDFYKRAFGAQELYRHATPDGKIMHAELRIGDSIIMLADEMPMGPLKSPQKLGGNSVVINLYVPEDVDALWNQATAAGAKVTFPLGDQFWGDRYGQVQDPWGFIWALGMHKEEVSPAELEKRAKEAFAQMARKAS